MLEEKLGVNEGQQGRARFGKGVSNANPWKQMGLRRATVIVVFPIIAVVIFSGPQGPTRRRDQHMSIVTLVLFVEIKVLDFEGSN